MSATRTAHARFSVTAIAIFVGLLLSGCTDTGTTATPAKPLELTIGALLPVTGAFSALAPAEAAGVRLASDEINKADLGITVTVETRDSGDASTPTATASVTDLLAKPVSAIVGASSADVTRAVVTQVTDAGVVMISPQNSAPDLSTLKDKGLFWRTAPSDALIGSALGARIAKGGAEQLGILWLKDDYGTAVSRSVKTAFTDAGGSDVDTRSYVATETDLSAKIATIAKTKPDAVVLLTTDNTPAVITAFVAAGVPAKNLYFTDRSLRQFGSTVAVPLDGATGVLAGPVLDPYFEKRIRDLNPGIISFAYAAETYDAVMVVVLAALAARSTDGKKIAAHLRAVSGGTGKGEKATDFASAAQIVIAGDPVDYDGYSGGIAFDKNGDPRQAPIGFFTFGPGNTYSRTK